MDVVAMRLDVSPAYLDSCAKVGMCDQRHVGLLLGGLSGPCQKAAAVARVARGKEAPARSLHLTISEKLDPLETQLPNDEGFIKALLRAVGNRLSPRASYLLTIKLAISPKTFNRMSLLVMQEGHTTLVETRVYEVFVEDLDRCVPRGKRNGRAFKAIYPKDIAKLKLPDVSATIGARLRIGQFEGDLFERSLSRFKREEDFNKIFSTISPSGFLS